MCSSCADAEREDKGRGGFRGQHDWVHRTTECWATESAALESPVRVHISLTQFRHHSEDFQGQWDREDIWRVSRDILTGQQENKYLFSVMNA